MDEHYLGEHYQDGGEVDPPEKTVKAYKLFRTNSKKPGQLFPLFVDANTPVPIGKWVAAKAGDPGKDPTKVKSKLGDLAYRPGWHAGDLPVATHIGGKSSPDLKAPDYRPDNHVWAEIEMPDDVDWQSVANSRMERTKAGAPKPATAHITDQVPFGGHYRYKTNPNMTGNWMIGGSMKVNRVLGDDEVKAINDSNGAADLPRLARADGGEVERFHGTDVHNLQKFDPSASRTAKYHYLADEPETAGAYGKHVYRVKLKPKNIISFHPENIGPKQMKVVHELSERLGENPNHLLHAITSADGSFYGTRGSLQDRVMDELKDMGHDAVRFPDVAPGGGWDMSTVVLDDSIIHSIDKHDPAIGKEGGGPVEQDGITAYHGSPHDFDEFDTSKIGTGEGAQAYGHGLYFAEHEPVAKRYKNDLSPTLKASDAIDPLHRRIGQMALTFSNNTPEGAIAWLDKYKNGAGHTAPAMTADAVAAVKQHFENGEFSPGGHMYEVHINAHPHHMLDWDKPLSEQSEHVQRTLAKSGHNLHQAAQDMFDGEPSDLRGADLYQWLTGKHEGGLGSPENVTKHLSGLGIKGIKYLDSGSRGDKAEPTHNYVVFDHNDVHIKRKYEQGGAVDNDVIPHGDPKREQNLTKWHKDSHSLTKNKDGSPRVFYHGTAADFDSFDNKKTGSNDLGLWGKGHYFSASTEGPNSYALRQGNGANVMPVHVSIKNPLVLKTGKDLITRLPDGTIDSDLIGPNLDGSKIKNIAQSNGHDGIIQLRPNGSVGDLVAYDSHQIKSATGNNGNFDPSNPDITKADGGDVWDDSRVRRSGEGGTETALDFIQNAQLYKQRMEAQAPQPAPVAAPSTEGKSMPVTAAPPPAIVQPAQPIQQKQEQPQGQVGLYAVGTNDPNPDMTVQSAQRIIESSRAMGINPVFLLPNQAGNTQYAQNSRALQKYLDENSIQYQMPQYGDKDPLHMTPSWASGASKSYNAPFLAGDSNSVRLGIVGYGAKGDGKTIVHPESGAVLGRVGANSKAVADELERHLKWQMQNRTQRNTGGPVTVSKGQDTAGNFKKEHEKIHGIPVAVEVKEGHDRVKYEPDGKVKFKAKQYADYGAILGTKDADGMNTDVMVGPHKDSEKVYIIDQRKHHDHDKFDEHKVMLGFDKRKKAIKAYAKTYKRIGGKKMIEDVVKTDIAGLKKWLKHGNLKVAAAKDALINRALEVVSKKT